MKITMQHHHVRSTHQLDSLVEHRIFALQPRLQIDEANVRLEHRYEESPAYRVRVHLVTPGPDVVAESRDHTMRAALDKVMAELNGQIDKRSAQRHRRIRGPRQHPRLKPLLHNRG